jgi:excisionase family DNA binding protein
MCRRGLPAPSKQEEPAVVKDFLNTINGLADRWEVDPVTIRRLIDRGELRAVMVGRSIRIRESEVERYLKQHEKAPA